SGVAESDLDLTLPWNRVRFARHIRSGRSQHQVPRPDQPETEREGTVSSPTNRPTDSIVAERPSTITTPAAPAGPIMAIGGAEDKLDDKLILATFVQLAGGQSAKIAIVPTASSIESAGERYKALFLGLGAEKAEVIYIADRGDADGDGPLELLEGATGIFLTGGNQMKLAALVNGTRVAALVRERNAAGAIVAGTSAG